MYLIYFVYLYLMIGLLSIYFKKPLPRIYLGLLIFFVFKWIFNYRKCTLSYIECKIRNVKKEKSHIYNYCEFFGDLIYSKYNDILFLLLVILLLINLFKICKNIQRHI